MNVAKRVVLAYSGGLDTSVAVRWMIDELGVEVVALAVDVGQASDDWDVVRERARAAGAVEAIVVDAREEFADDFVAPALKANAMYEGRYPLVSALSRPVIVKHLVEAARSRCRRRRPRLHRQGQRPGALRGLDPGPGPRPRRDRPVRGWGMTREDSILYAYRHEIPIQATKEKVYSIDDNLWGRAIECGEMEDPWAVAAPGRVAADPADRHRAHATWSSASSRGVPVSVDGERLGMAAIIAKLNDLVGSYGWGRIDMVENRRVGIKSRETYECPAALALIMAHRDLESICLERDLEREKARFEPATPS
jgi:argininosuccinate synthase